MARLYDVGPKTYAQALVAATVNYQPPLDRGALITRIELTNPSAADTWTLNCGGRDVGHIYLDTVGNQQLMGALDTSVPKTNNIFDWAQLLFGQKLSYPVPEALTMTIASVGGATADILIEAEEHTAADITVGMLNHPRGGHFLLPVYAYRAATVNAAGAAAFDTEVAPSWVPKMFTGGNFPPGFRARLKALCIEGGGVNTYSGAADHQSVTAFAYAVRNGQSLFNRLANAAGGIPAPGKASAAGSANKVYGAYADKYAAFQFLEDPESARIDGDFVYGSGDSYVWGLGITGDVTGNADYSTYKTVGLVELWQGA